MHTMSRSGFLTLFLALGSAVNGDPTVTIPSGTIVGTETSPTNQPEVTAKANAYLGIPYADSPPERFSRPKAPQPWTGELQAKKIRDACMQQATGFQEEVPQSEDCLYVNVWTPQGETSSEKKTVMVWIHGGNLQDGSTAIPWWDGTSLAVNEDIIVVTLNYRLNVFGFANAPGIDPNIGFYDQRLALEWVQQNIEHFGGDPSKVTVFGESAGGYSVKQLLANPPDPLPFRAAIVQSQQTLLGVAGALNFKRVQKHFNCTETDLECLREIPAEDIKAFIEEKSLSFQAVSDGVTSLADIRPSISSGKFANVPVLIGSNKDEATVFVEAFTNLSKAEDRLEAEGKILENLGVKESDITAFRKAKRPDIDEPDQFEILSRTLTDLIFTCPAGNIASYMAEHNRRKIWRYRYSADFPNTRRFPRSGAYHGAEIAEVFGTYPLKNDKGDATEQQIKLSAHMQKIWADFAKDPQKGPGWAAVNPFRINRRLADFGRDDDDEHKVIRWIGVDQYCKALNYWSKIFGFAW